MTKTLLSVPKRTLGRMKVLAQRRKTTVSRLFREAVEKTCGLLPVRHASQEPAETERLFIDTSALVTLRPA